jgi:hypothetical protein
VSVLTKISFFDILIKAPDTGAPLKVTLTRKSAKLVWATAAAALKLKMVTKRNLSIVLFIGLFSLVDESRFFVRSFVCKFTQKSTIKQTLKKSCPKPACFLTKRLINRPKATIL